MTAGEVVERREELASGLRRQLGTVWPETDHKRHPGALALFVGDEDMTTAEQPSWPLARRGAADMFAPVVFGTDPRGRAVTVTLMFASVIIGSIPEDGQDIPAASAAAHLRARRAGRDARYSTSRAPATSSRSPRSAHAYRAGEEPEDIEYLVADLRKLRTEMRRRTSVIRDDLDERRCPENKVTPELAADPRLGLHPIVVALDECQVAFEHEDYGKELESHLHRPDQARPRARHHADARHPAARRQVDTDRHQRQRRAPDVPQGDGPGRERHGPRHVDVQERHPGHDVRPRGQGRVLLRWRGAQPGHHARATGSTCPRLRPSPPAPG